MILELQIAAEYKVRVDYIDPRQLGLPTQTDGKKQKGAKPTGPKAHFLWYSSVAETTMAFPL